MPAAYAVRPYRFSIFFASLHTRARTLQRAQDRLEEVQGIAIAIVELDQMAGDLGILIAEQTEQLNEIEEGVDSMTGKVNKSQEDIRKAIEQLKQARRKKVQIIILVTVVALILFCIAFATLFYFVCLYPARSCWDAIVE